MRHLMHRLWSDDSGAIISTEFLFIVTILVIGLITGWVAVRNSINAEMEELANAIGTLSQGYSFGGQQIEAAVDGTITDGSQALDTPNPTLIISNVSAAGGPSSNITSLLGDPLN